MIALLRGVLIEKHPNQALVDVGGVGYDVTIPVSTYTHLPETGAEVRLHVHTHVREDALAFFGFLTHDEKALFEKLISVSGIGPKMAMAVLSGIPASGSDHHHPARRGRATGPHPRRWQKDRRAHGAGTARQDAGAVRRRHCSRTSVLPASALTAVEQDVLSALLNLGCARPAAEAAVRKARAGRRAPAPMQISNRFSGGRWNWYGKLKKSMPDRQLVSGARQPEDAQFEAGLRPRRLADFAGQTKLKENLSIAIEAARMRGEAMDHVLLYGPPGLGKTTLACIIAEELRSAHSVRLPDPCCRKNWISPAS